MVRNWVVFVGIVLGTVLGLRIVQVGCEGLWVVHASSVVVHGRDLWLLLLGCGKTREVVVSCVGRWLLGLVGGVMQGVGTERGFSIFRLESILLRDCGRI